MENPWATVAERANKFARFDSRLGRRLADLSKHLARDEKLAFAIDEGRVYGLRQQKYGMLLKKQLNADWRRPPTEEMW